MKHVSEVFSAFGGPAMVARALGVRPSTASEMKRRGSIPAEYWLDLVREAKRMRIAGIDAETLVRLHARNTEEFSSEATEIEGVGQLGRRGERTSTGSGHFSRFQHLRRPHFASAEAIDDHVRALREEWDRR